MNNSIISLEYIQNNGIRFEQAKTLKLNTSTPKVASLSEPSQIETREESY